MCDKSPSASETNNESPYSSLNPKQLDEAAKRALDYYLGPKPEAKKKPASNQLFTVVDGIDTECLLANLSETLPVYFWTPSIAPSGLLFYTGDLFPAWKRSVFVGAMAGKRLVRLELDGNRVIAEEPLLVERGKRIRDIRQGPDGAVYVLTAEAAGELLRLTPPD